jgi:hypothetical protein
LRLRVHAELRQKSPPHVVPIEVAAEGEVRELDLVMPKDLGRAGDRVVDRMVEGVVVRGVDSKFAREDPPRQGEFLLRLLPVSHVKSANANGSGLAGFSSRAVGTVPDAVRLSGCAGTTGAGDWLSAGTGFAAAPDSSSDSRRSSISIRSRRSRSRSEGAPDSDRVPLSCCACIPAANRSIAATTTQAPRRRWVFVRRILLRLTGFGQDRRRVTSRGATTEPPG